MTASHRARVWMGLAGTLLLSTGCDQTRDEQGATTAIAEPAGPREGKDYISLPGSRTSVAANQRVQVIEVFWYGCRYCYSLDRVMQSWHSPGVEVRRVPGTAIELARTHARLFYTLQALGQLERLHGLIFNAVLSGNRLATADQIQAFLLRYGIDGGQFRSVFFSKAIDAQVAQADAVTQQYRIDAVPCVVINGKYKTDLEMAGGEQHLLAVIDALAQREQGR